jgi:hypothetical protein
MQAAIRMAEKVGAGLGKREVLLGPLPEDRRDFTG